MSMSMIICLSSCAPHGFEFFCMASVHGLLEGSWLVVKWFMVVLGVDFRGSKWRFKGRTGGLKIYTVQCVFTVCRVRLVLSLRAASSGHGWGQVLTCKKDIIPAEALNDKGHKVRPCEKTFQRLHLCVQRTNLHKRLTYQEQITSIRESGVERVCVKIHNANQRNEQHTAVLVAKFAHSCGSWCSAQQRAYTARHIIHAQPIAVTKLNIRTLTSELDLAHAVCHNESPSNADPPPAKSIQATAQGLQLRTTAAGSYDSTSANSTFYHHKKL
ncbi:hypothetical protein F511_33720 [Dorcoceras hygrometricum]|uniref:Uncharacterized protein n=1 Tax=Dorcoceras hygrometricum TaxID=472368 RepID=A0A2Z7D7E1_9LAMI|nr:hypothetical protein F511_33720 [Dorcoceras hygrometricum]